MGLTKEGDDGKGGRIARDEMWFMSAGGRVNWSEVAPSVHLPAPVYFCGYYYHHAPIRSFWEGELDFLIELLQNKKIRIFKRLASSM